MFFGVWLEPKQQNLCSGRTSGEASPWTALSEQHTRVGLALEHLSLHFSGAVRYLCSFCGHCHITTLAPTGAASSTGGLAAGQPWPGDTGGVCPCKGSGAKILIFVTAQVPASLGYIRTHTQGSTDTGKAHRDPSMSLQTRVTLNLRPSRGKHRLFLPV